MDIITEIFYKRDAATGQLRPSKTRIISALFFIVIFFIGVIGLYSEWGFLEFEDIIASIIAAFVLTVPVFIIGWFIGYLIDRNATPQYNNPPYNNQQYNNQPNMNQQYNQQYNNPQYNNQQYPNQQYNNPQYNNQPNMNQQYNQQYNNQQYPNQQYNNPQYNNQPNMNQQYNNQPNNNQQYNPIQQQPAQPMNDFKINQHIDNIMKEWNLQENDYNALKQEGNRVVPNVLEYLKKTVNENVAFRQKSYLVQLLGDINTDESLQAVSDIMFLKSNCTGWYNDVVKEVAIVLGNTNDKKWLPSLEKALDEDYVPIDVISNSIEKLSGEKTTHPNVVLDDAMHNKEGYDAIEYLYSIKDQTNSWTPDQLGYYYYILGFNSQKIPELKEKNLHKVFFAAQVYYSKSDNAAGWSFFEDETTNKNQETAKQLHEKYPVPETYEDLINNKSNVVETINTTKETKSYLEKDNMGTIHDTLDVATAYWLGERLQKTEKDPFTMYIFENGKDAEDALLELPYIHKAEDTGNLICDDVYIYGYYKVDENNYEAIVCGKDLTYDEFKQAEDSFSKHGGRLKNNLEPDKSVKKIEIQNSGNTASSVRFREKFNKDQYTYECYDADTKSDALEFLKNQTVTQKLYYVCVYTPEGNYGLDIQGIYQM